MRAITIAPGIPNSARLEDVPEPPPAEGSLLVSALALGVCGTDREIIETDVVIVGAGPAGLAAAIRLKQKSPETSVTVVEKAAEIGGHILSGAVMDPSGLTELLPDWRARGAPVGPNVTHDVFHLLTRKRDFRLPNLILPPLMKTLPPDAARASMALRRTAPVPAPNATIPPGVPAAPRTSTGPELEVERFRAARAVI